MFLGIGNFVMPPIIQYLIEKFGWRESVLILAGITLFCALFGSFFKPLKLDIDDNCNQQLNGQKPLLMRIKEARAAEWARSEEELTEESPTGSQNSAPPPYSEVLTTIKLNDDYYISKNSLCKKLNENNADNNRIRSKSALSINVEEVKTLPKKISPRDEMLYSNLSLVILPQSRSYANLNQSAPNGSFTDVNENFLSGFDLSLLKRPSFVLLALSGFLCLVGFFIPFIYLSDRAKLLGTIDAHFIHFLNYNFWY